MTDSEDLTTKNQKFKKISEMFLFFEISRNYFLMWVVKFQQMAGLIVAHLADHGTRILHKCVPVKVEKEHCGRLKVTWQDGEKQVHHEQFDTVMFAVGESFF